MITFHPTTHAALTDMLQAILGVRTKTNESLIDRLVHNVEKDEIISIHDINGESVLATHIETIREIVHTVANPIIFHFNDSDLTKLVTTISCSPKLATFNSPIRFLNGKVNCCDHFPTFFGRQIEFHDIIFSATKIRLHTHTAGGRICKFIDCKFIDCEFSVNENPDLSIPLLMEFCSLGDTNYMCFNNKFDTNSGLNFYNRFHKRLPTSKLLPAGEFLMYKKVRGYNKKSRILESYVVELKVPACADRLISLEQLLVPMASEHKVRVSSAKMTGKVYRVMPTEETKKVPVNVLKNITLYSSHDPAFVYSTRMTIKPIHPFDKNLFATCASGIHGFLNFNLAMKYVS